MIFLVHLFSYFLVTSSLGKDMIHIQIHKLWIFAYTNEPIRDVTIENKTATQRILHNLMFVYLCSHFGSTKFGIAANYI